MIGSCRSAKTNKDYKLIRIGCGTDDTLSLNDKGITHDYYAESPGHRHDYSNWRVCLHALLPKRFRE